MKRQALIVLALFAASLAGAQSLTISNLKGPISRASGQAPAKTKADLWKQINGLPAANPSPTPTPVPIDTLPVGGLPKPRPTPEPKPTFVPTATTTTDLAGVPAIPSDFNVNDYLVPSWPVASMAPDVVGAFRFQCEAGQLNWDDEIRFPGQIGASPHLHQHFGNTLGGGMSTFESLRAAGDSTCNNKINRSDYWIPAMMDGSTGKVVKPNYVNIYYKRRPASDPYCFTMAEKGCIALPRGLRYIFGYNAQTGAGLGTAEIKCITHSWTDVSGVHRDIPTAAADCPVGDSIEIGMTGPNCWNGRDLDSPDHMSHMAYATWGPPYDGKEHCPAGYPYVVPAFSIGAFYTNDGTAPTWYLSSDRMPGMAPMPPGSTFHSDWYGAWDDSVMKIWTANCIDKMLSCSGGPLGDGRMMRMDRGYPADQFGPTIKVDPPART